MNDENDNNAKKDQNDTNEKNDKRTWTTDIISMMITLKNRYDNNGKRIQYDRND